MFILSSSLSLSAQTHTYKGVMRVDENGVREKWDSEIHITFTQNKTRVYESDIEGNLYTENNAYPQYSRRIFERTSIKDERPTYTLILPEDPRKTNPYVSGHEIGFYLGMMSAIKQKGEDKKTFTFSPDYKRVNIWQRRYGTGPFHTYVYELKVDSDVSAPDNFY